MEATLRKDIYGYDPQLGPTVPYGIVFFTQYMTARCLDSDGVLWGWIGVRRNANMRHHHERGPNCVDLLSRAGRVKIPPRATKNPSRYQSWVCVTGPRSWENSFNKTVYSMILEAIYC